MEIRKNKDGEWVVVLEFTIDELNVLERVIPQNDGLHYEILNAISEFKKLNLK